jgi:hypothetical protein
MRNGCDPQEIRMPNLLRLSAVLMVWLTAGCTPLSESAKPGVPSPQRQTLNEGYSLLYQDAGNLDAAELITYVKVESEAVEGIMSAAGDLGGDLKKQLEQIARDYPAVRIDLDPLPEIEKRKRSAISKDRARYFAPMVGRGGREYELTVLIGYLNGANHERHLCEVMAELEPNANLKKFLLDAGKRYDGIYQRTDALLQKEYFRNPTGKSKD